MRDLHQLSGTKEHVEFIENAHELVIGSYPEATREGSVGSWSWHVMEELVAEAWLHRLSGWWVRIKR